MKIEGIPYPLPAHRMLSRGGESVVSAGASEDAVYFEPDDRRREKKEHKEQELPKNESSSNIEIQVLAEVSPELNSDLETIDVTQKKTIPRVVDVLA